MRTTIAVIAFVMPIVLFSFVAAPRFYSFGLVNTNPYPVGTVEGVFTNSWGTYSFRAYYPATRAGQGAAPDRSAAPYPLVVFAPGFAASIDNYVWVGEQLARWGYVVVLFTVPMIESGQLSQLTEALSQLLVRLDSGNLDLSTLGRISSLLSSVSVEDVRKQVDIHEWSDGILSVIAEVPMVEALQGMIDVKKIASAGHSMGGAGAILAGLDARIAVVSVWAPGLADKQSVQEWIQRIRTMIPAKYLTVLNGLLEMTLTRVNTDTLDPGSIFADVLDAAGRIHVPTQIGVGSEDFVVATRLVHQYYAALPSEGPKEYYVINGGNHVQFAHSANPSADRVIDTYAIQFDNPAKISQDQQREIGLRYMLAWLQYFLEKKLNARSQIFGENFANDQKSGVITAQSEFIPDIVTQIETGTSSTSGNTMLVAVLIVVAVVMAVIIILACSKYGARAHTQPVSRQKQ